MEEKNRYLFYNSDGKIFVLINYEKMMLPGSFTNLTGKTDFKYGIETIKDDLVKIHTHQYLYECFKNENLKLKKKRIEVVKYFWSYYIENNEIFYKLYAYFCQFGFECYLVDFDTIINLETNIKLDSGMKAAVLKLSKKLNYEIE